ncbi:hypothetical protein PpBr36_03684 [Pyricularia pennisetigena]|uniref:hypothetical protein n=1 Tax=Pyricularia pennisetigena TaxID=1578925 RepID=UPI001151B05A|nr:hypothetical protein PpBr36_03684 [Pyricularia pennisetigena]TLS31598.1 hypothetical protein PpBr36_03684 [Pyricularia pennisetigena]
MNISQRTANRLTSALRSPPRVERLSIGNKYLLQLRYHRTDRRPTALDDSYDLNDLAVTLAPFKESYAFSDPTQAPSWLAIARAKSKLRPQSKRQSPKRIPEATSMLSQADLVWAPTADTAGSAIWLHCDSRRYLIGRVPEGTQRVLAGRSNDRPIIKLEEIMITGPIGSETCGGLMGMVLTLAASKAMAVRDNGPKSKKNDPKAPSWNRLRLRGSRNLPYYLAMGRSFILRQKLPLDVNEILADPRLEDPSSSEHDWEDENIRVWHVPLSANTSHSPGGRKRARVSHDDDGKPEPEMLSETDQQLVKSVLMTMFETDWRLDGLVEIKLSEARRDATLYVRKNGNLEEYHGPLPGDSEPVPDITVLTRRNWNAGQIRNLPKTSPSSTSMCYIVKLQPRRGKFDKEAAEKFGIQHKQRGLICMGHSITTDSGDVITPEMVMAPPIPGMGFAVVDVPSADYVDSLLSRPEWDNEKIMSDMVAIYWTLGKGLADDERILAFMRKHSHLRHTVSSLDVCANHISFETSTKGIIRHHYLDQKRFPLPVFNNVGPMGDLSSKPFLPAKSEARLELAPKYAFQDDRVQRPLTTDAKELRPSSAVRELIDAARETVKTHDFKALIQADNKDLPCPDAEVIALGTGSSLPSIYRNVSATLVRVPGAGNYLFDCGESTLSQLRRHYGIEGADEILRDLRVLWLSHPHADHHLGTASLLQAWDAATSSVSATTSEGKPPSLTVVGPQGLMSYIREYQNVEHISNRLTLIGVARPNRSTRISEPITFTGTDQANLGGLTRIDVARTDHCFDSFATVFTWEKTGLKVAYSGDCRPSDDFVHIGQGATLLIHEATFENEKQGDAIAKKHSTMREAMDVARRMKARRVLMTHFSQRYANIPKDLERRNSANMDMIVLFAFDHMRAKLGEFTEAVEFLPALQKMYTIVLKEEHDEAHVSTPDLAAGQVGEGSTLEDVAVDV